MVKIIKYNDSNFSGALEKIIKSKREAQRTLNYQFQEF